MKCIDNESEENGFMIKGNYNSAKAIQFTLRVEVCDREKRDTCKDEETIKEWLSSKYVIVLSNQMIFNDDKYGEESITKSSRLDWY